jgi:hypothetical protein
MPSGYSFLKNSFDCFFFRDFQQIINVKLLSGNHYFLIIILHNC